MKHGKIVVLSDTHMPRPARHLPASLIEEFGSADLIIHLGDFTHEPVVEMLQSYAPLRAVHGNNDTEAIRLRFPLVDRFELNGRRIALLHGHVGGRTALEAARRVQDADLVLFGHSHRPQKVEENGRVLFNPGSPTDRRWWEHRGYGIIEVQDERLEVKLVPLT